MTPFLLPGDQLRGAPETALQRIDTHEQICAIRYEAINARLRRIEGIMITSAGATILLLAGFVIAAIRG